MIVAELLASLGLVPDEKSWEKGHELVETLHHAMEAYLGYEGLMKVKELIEGTVEAANEAKNLGEQLGITSDAMQELGYAAYVSDVSAGQLQGAMQRLSRGLEDAKKGSGGTHDALQKLGVHMDDLKNHSLDQNLETLADAFEKAGPKVNKTALAIELFGRSAGPRMLLMLNKGREGIEGMRDEAEDLGFVIGGETIEASEEFEMAQKRLHATLIGVRNEAVGAILPALKEMAEGLSEWVKENREAIASALTTVLKGLAAAFHVVGVVLSTVIDFFKEHHDILGALVVAIGIYEAAAIASAIATAAAWVLSFAPLVLGVAAITLVILAVKKLVEYITGKSMTWSEMWDTAVDGGERLADWLSELPDRAEDWIIETVDNIREAFDELWHDVIDGAHDAWSMLEDIPVIGRILKGGEAIVGAVQNGISGDTVKGLAGMVPGVGLALDSYDAAQNGTGLAGALAPGTMSVLGYGPQATPDAPPVINIGDTHIQIDASAMTPDQLKDAVRVGAGEAHQDAIRQAVANLSGGKR